MRLKTPSAPFSPVYVHGESITIETEGKVLVLPSGNPNILPLNNEYTLNSNRLSIAESPFGGLKGSGSPDYAPGTINIVEGDGVYLQDTSGTNSSKTLSAGGLYELGLLNVDTTNHTITEEFIIRNDGAGSDVQVIDDCDSTAGWNIIRGTISLDTVDKIWGSGAILATATELDPYMLRTVNLDLSSTDFITVYVKGVNGKTIECFLISDWFSTPGVSSYNKYILQCNGGWQKWVIPIRKPHQVVGSPDMSKIISIRFGIPTARNGETFRIDNITACNGTWAQVEVAVPDFAKSTSSNYFDIYAHNGTAYETSPAFKSSELNGTVYQANLKMLDGTKAGDMYAATGQFYRGMAVTTLGKRLDQVAKVSPSYQDPNFVTPVQISSNYGTLKRRIIAILIPPSDNGRTGINQCRLKLVTYYDKGIDGYYSSTYEFSNDTNTSTGLQNVINPWIAILDPDSPLIDFYLFTHRPKNLSFKRNESGQIYEITLYPGNGLLYHGQIYYSDVTRDTDSNNIPDCLEASVEGSLTKFLQAYGMVI